MLSIFLARVCPYEEIFVNQEIIKTYILDNNQRLVIDGTGKSAFLHVSAHYYSGKLNITATANNNQTIISPEIGDRLLFIDSKINITYTQAKSACKIVLYLLDRDKCPAVNYHIRGAKKSIISSDNYLFKFPVCYLYDFSTETSYKYSLDQSNTVEIDIIIQRGNKVAIENIEGKVATPRLNSLFVVRMEDGNFSKSSVEFSNGRIYGDWTDRDRDFNCWPVPLCSREPQNTRYLDVVKTDRRIEWWFLALLFVVMSIAIIAMIILLFNVSDDNGLSSKPLLSMANN